MTLRMSFAASAALAVCLGIAFVLPSRAASPMEVAIREPVASGGLTLDMACRLALDRNEKIQLSEEQMASTRENIRRARAGILPTLSTSVTQSMNKVAGAGGFATFRYNRDLRLDLEQPLYGGGKEWAALRASKVGEEISREQIRFAKQALLLDVSVAYFSVIREQEKLTVSQRSLDLAQQELNQAQARKNAGTATRTDVVRAEVEVTKAKTDLLRAENAVQTSRVRLGFLIGEPVISPVQNAEADADESWNLSHLDPLVQQAMVARSDARIAQLDIQASEEGVKIARAKYFPSAKLIGNLSRTENVSAFRENDNWQVQAKLDYDIFEGFGRDAEYEQSKIVLHQATLSRMYLSREVELDVREAMLDIESLNAILEEGRNQVRLAQENYDRETAQYREGLATPVDVADAHTALITAEEQVAATRADLQIARRKADFAVGTIDKSYLKGESAR